MKNSTSLFYRLAINKPRMVYGRTLIPEAGRIELYYHCCHDMVYPKNDTTIGAGVVLDFAYSSFYAIFEVKFIYYKKIE